MIMKKLIIVFVSIFGMFFINSCSSDDGGDDGSGPTPPPAENNDPSAVSQLIYPSSDLLCIESTITFQWGAASDIDGDPISYVLVVAEDRNFTTIVEQRTVSVTSLSISLQPGTAYYWKVTAIDNQGGTSAPSSTFAFYTEGLGISNHAPFTAALNTPEDGAIINQGTVNLSWTGGDSDTGDTIVFDLYFGDDINPPAIETGLSVENFDVSAVSGTTYYWKVDSIDDSGVKTLGQIWTFTVN